jgi:hypothetical protein
MMPTTCSRCQRTDERPFIDLASLEPLVEAWEGTLAEPVCPHCQLAAWHLHCTGVVDVEGVRVEIGAIPRSEWDANSVFRCGYIDVEHRFLEEDEWPIEWTCPKCGGTRFEFVRRDYLPSGLQPGSFSGEVEEFDDA